MRGRWLAVLAFLVFLPSSSARADDKDKAGPFIVFASTVQFWTQAPSGTTAVTTLVRYEPKTGKTWVMIPAPNPAGAPYWVPVEEPVTTKGS